jgi:DNA polymerase zeta
VRAIISVFETLADGDAALSRGELLPNPEFDEDQVVAISYCFQADDYEPFAEGDRRSRYRSGIIGIESETFSASRIRDFTAQVVLTEADLLNAVIDLVMELDPDVLCGWELQNSSWGYLSDRATKFGRCGLWEVLTLHDADSSCPGLGLGELVSRINITTAVRPTDTEDRWGITHTSTFKVAGRHVLNVWRVMRAEKTLSRYPFENVVFHLLRRRQALHTVPDTRS